MQNSVVMFIFCGFGWKYSFQVNLVPKNQNWHFNLKFGTETISNIQNLMFILSVLDWKHLFWANVVQKSKFSV